LTLDECYGACESLKLFDLSIIFATMLAAPRTPHGVSMAFFFGSSFLTKFTTGKISTVFPGVPVLMTSYKFSKGFGTFSTAVNLVHRIFFPNLSDSP